MIMVGAVKDDALLVMTDDDDDDDDKGMYRRACNDRKVGLPDI